MENNQLNLDYRDIGVLVGELYGKLLELKIKPKAVYGVPRGGALPAYILAAKFGMFPHEKLSDINEKKLFPALIVDDVLDSGKTLNRFHLDGEFYKAVLLSKNREIEGGVISARKAEPKTWINFPWEINDKEESEGIEDNIIRILQFIGEDPNREGLLETPKRVRKAYAELFEGYKKDPAAVLSKEFVTTYDQMVVLKDIEFFSFCEHHMLPFFGKASVAYIPTKKVVGISKLARLVDVYARRLQIQEQMTDQIAEAMEKNLHPLGVAVTITAKHFCMVTRGVKKQNSEMTTTSLRGAFKENPETRAEFFSRI